MTPAESASTFATVETPPGAGAIAVLLLAGPSAFSIAQALFKPNTGQWPDRAERDRLCYGHFIDPRNDSETIDDGLVALQQGDPTSGASHSGWHGLAQPGRGDPQPPRPTDCAGRPCHPALPITTRNEIPPESVEMTVHGGVRVVERMLDALAFCGATIGPPPSIDCIESDARRLLARAQTKRAVRLIARQRRLLADEFSRIGKLLESDTLAAIKALRVLRDGSRGAVAVAEGATVAFFGPPNAGKSTLINAIIGRQSSLVSETAGTTRDWVDANTAIEGVPLRMIDTAGQRTTGDPLETEAIRRGWEQLRTADVKILVLDGSVPPPPDFSALLTHFEKSSANCIAINKSDLPQRWSADAIPNPGWRCVATSGLSDDGTTALGDAILTLLGADFADADKPMLFSRRQVAMVESWLSDPKGPSGCEIDQELRSPRRC